MTHRGARTALLVAATCVCLTVGPAAPVPAAGQEGKQVWALYMGFWDGEGSWNAQANVLDDYPLLGKYAASSPRTARTQIDQARKAGIDAFVVAWRGRHDGAATGALLNLLDQAKSRDFHVAAVLDHFDGGDVGQSTASLRYLMSDVIDHPAYLRYHGRPVILFAFQREFNWRAIRKQVDPDQRTVWIAEGLRGEKLYGGAMDGMYAFNFAWANGASRLYQRDSDAVAKNGGSVFVPTVHPGWDENKLTRRDGRGNPTSPRARAGGDFLRRTWEGAMSARTDVVMVVSWNEFMENSHIEPSRLYGTEALDTLRPLVAAWKGGGGGVGPDDDLVAEADDLQKIQFNPDATLQKRIFADGFVPNSGEFDVDAAGRTWRGQRAEHLGTGRVRVYYVPVGEWDNWAFAERGGARTPLDRTLLAEGQRNQSIQFNPGAALQKRIFADGFVPNSPEFRATVGGADTAAQRAEHLRTGEVRVYYARVGDFGNVRFVVRPGGRRPPPPPPPSGPIYRIDGWDPARRAWVEDEVVLPADDVCSRVRWYTENIAEVYLEHAGYGTVPGSDQIGEGEMPACLEAADRRAHRWVLHVLLRDGTWVEDAIVIRGDAQGPTPTASPPDEAVHRFEVWDPVGEQWTDDDVVLPADDVCTRLRWYTENIAEVYLDHVGHGPVPGSDEIGAGELEACLEASSRLPQEWVLHVHLRDGTWVTEAITISSE